MYEGFLAAALFPGLITNVFSFHVHQTQIRRAYDELSMVTKSKDRLLRSAFDATIQVRLEHDTGKMIPWPASGPTKMTFRRYCERLGLTRNADLRISSSSSEMDALCGRDMSTQRMDEAWVLHGLPDLVEIVTRVLEDGEMPGDSPALHRAMLTCLDAKGQEFDCEVRVVTSEDSIGNSVLCGVRTMGEKRTSLRAQHIDKQLLDVEAPSKAPPVLARKQGENQWPFRAFLWQLLFAPAPVAPPPRISKDLDLAHLLPAGQAVWKSLRSVGNVLMSVPQSVGDQQRCHSRSCSDSAMRPL